ncbi:MAG: mu-protocadherin-cell-suface protein [Luteolibacter sp.]
MSPGAANRPSQRPGAGTADRPGAGAANRPGAGTADRPGAGTANRPGRDDVGNFLGVGAAGGAGRPSQLPANRPRAGDRGNVSERSSQRRADRPQDRSNWSERSQNRNENWNQRVDNRSESWDKRQENGQQRRDDFQKNRDDRWNNLENSRNDRQDWRDQNREDWHQHREDMWDYRYDRADEVWDNARDYYDDCFDDNWWGHAGWGYYGGHYPANPWWWWAPATWNALSSFVYTTPAQPVYVDYGTTVVQEGETVYVDNKPIPAEKYNEPIENLAASAETPPPPLPPQEGKPAEWMSLGVFALAQEEKGDPVMLFQLSVSRDGKISGGYESTLTDDKKPIAGQVDKETQNVAWRIGDNRETVFATSLANLTQDVSTVAVHFGKGRVQNWLLVRMPEPPPAGQPPKAPELNRTVPPVTPIPVKTN